MPRHLKSVVSSAILLAVTAFVVADRYSAARAAAAVAHPLVATHDVIFSAAVRHDQSRPLTTTPMLTAGPSAATRASAVDPLPPLALAPEPFEDDTSTTRVVPPPITTPSGSAAVEQRSQGRAAGPAIVASFDGLGADFQGPQGAAFLRNPSDNTLAVGPDHVVQIVNTRMAIFTKRGATFDTTGTVLYGPVETRAVFDGFPGACSSHNNGDAVVRYDQLAGRWLIVMPIFARLSNGDSTLARGDTNAAHYAVCYAVSTGASPFGPYYRYEFRRRLFPDYPRPAVWPDAYYVATSSGDDVIQKTVCAVDRARMLRGEPATEQCVTVDGVNFLNVADLDGPQRPAPGTPAIVMAAGGTQLKGVMEDDGVYAWRFHVDWSDSTNTSLTGPVKIAVAPYHYLCDGQLSDCVPQPGTDRRLDAQGDKLMARLAYRRLGDQQSIVAVQSVNTTEGGGGVRWYEFRLAAGGALSLYQQGTFAPDSGYRWMGSATMDGAGNIGLGYSFGGADTFPGQRFAGRLAADPLGRLTLHETVLAEGEAAQTTTRRWEDYAQTAVDPSDDCTIWYVGDFYKKGAAGYSTRIGAFRMPGCGAGGASAGRAVGQ